MATTTNTAPTFNGRDGKLTTSIETWSYDRTGQVAVQKDGKILVAGLDDGKFALARYNADGTIDKSFSGDGILTATWSTNQSTMHVTAQSDGKVVVTALSGMGYTATRYLSNGDIDTAFGNKGVLNSLPGIHYGTDFAMRADGKIVTVGSGYASQTDYTIQRFNVDGTLDTSFDGDGTATVDVGLGGNTDTALRVLAQADGKLVVSGKSYALSPAYSLVRLNANGTLDTSFSGDGQAQVTAATGTLVLTSAMALQADGKILVGGSIMQSSRQNMTVMRYNADGSLDTGFNGTGSVTLASSFSTPYEIKALAVQKDGKILAVGNGTFEEYASNIVVVRFLADGSLDKTFGIQGKAEIPIQRSISHGPATIAKEVVVQGDGKILVTASGGSGTDLTLIRVDANGRIDQTFSPAAGTLDHSSVFRESYGRGTIDSYSTVVLDPDVRIYDAELSAANNFNGATLTLKRHGGANADDVFSAKQNGTLSVLTTGGYFSVDGVTIGRVTTNAAGTLALTFSANATQALVDKTMQQIAYANGSDGAPEQVQIDWTFNDRNTGAQGSGGALGTTGSTIVKIAGTNDDPELKQQLPSQKLATGMPFSYVIPASTFDDPDHDVLNYSVAMSDGSAVPPWLSFDPATRTLSGTPDTFDTGTLMIRVLVRDAEGDTASTVFHMSIETPSTQVSGTAGADKLAGSAGNDVLRGYAGNDTLDGKTGADTMAGGDGNDIYYVDNAGDVVDEAGTAAGGIDIVYSALGYYYLGQNVENGRVLQATAGDLTGNELANVLYAGSGDNVLDGGLGTDTVSYAFATAGVTVSLNTRQAQDTEESGIDTLRDIENLTGSRFDDVLVGSRGNNTINGGTGADLMSGGNGSDIYVVDDAADIVRETNADTAQGGTDTVMAAVGYKLGANLENLTLTGSAAINGTGNALANTITGNASANVLDGGAGADKLIGGLGKDVMDGGAGNDVFVFNAAGETGTASATWDVINGFVRGQDRIDLTKIDANTATTANDAFTGFIAATTAFGKAGQLKVVNGILYGNTDADVAAEFAIQLTGIAQLGTADVML